MKRHLLTTMCIMASSALYVVHAQQTSVAGKVTDGSGNPVSGATITIKGTNQGTSTNESGLFTLNANPNATVVISGVGYQTQEINLAGRNTLSVSLQPSNTAIDEVVVTALGIERSERSLGYAAQKVSSEDLNVNKQANLVNALQGKVAGTQISSTGGGPGQGASIRIRGINSIDPERLNDPLFVIDGILIDNSTNNFGNSNAALRGNTNRAADINPEDIETINILKGGAATALYGLRGSNGVVVITTKKGKEGFQINYSTSYGIDNVNKIPDMQTTYTAGILGVYTPIGLGPAWGPTIEEAKALDDTHPDKLFNKYERAYETGNQYRNGLTISGGNELVRSYLSLSSFNQKGMMPFTDFKNYGIRLNNELKISSKITAGLNLNYNNSGGYKYNADRFGESLAYFSGRWDVRDYINEDGTQVWRGTNNPIYGAATNKFKDDVHRFIGGASFAYTPTDWLSFSYRIGYDHYNDNRFTSAPGPRGIPGERLYDNSDGSVGEYNTKFRAINSTFIATLQKEIATDLKGTLRLGHDLYDRDINKIGVLGTGLTIFDWYNLANAAVIDPTDPNREQYRLMGVFAEAAFEYKDYLYLNLTGRQDKTSTLAKPNNSFFYPSATLSYILSSHVDLPSYFDMVKLRASYAQIGKDATPYSTVSAFATYAGLPPGYTGFTRSSNLGNINLKPEFTNTFEIGTELGFLDNRLGLDFTYYNSISKDQILRANISSTTGYVTTSINAGDLRNRGVEIILRGTPIKTSDFQWTSTLNWSANRNKILSINEGLDEIVYASQSGYSGSTVTMKLIPGQAYGNLYGTHYARYYGSETEDPIFIDKSKPIIIDANGFPVRAPLASQKLLGNTQPDWIGGFMNTFNYKNLSLTVLFDARWGFEKYNQLENWDASFGTAAYTADRRSWKVFDGVLADGTPNTKAVWLDQGTYEGVNYGEGYYRVSYRTVSENFVQDASWIRLRTLSLGYTLPSTLLKSKVIKNINFNLTGNNLWLHTDYYGLDPESSSTDSGSNIDGFSGFTYPAARSFIFGLSVGF